MKTVAVVGVGLIGASFGLALRRAGFTGRILGVSSKSAVEAGLATGAISEEATLEQAANAADLIYLSQPVDRIFFTLDALRSSIRGDCLVTDAGSTKAAIAAKAADCLPGGAFLGGHPMAGKERRGAEVAEAGLFQDRPYILTPTHEMSQQMLEFEEWLKRLGARTVRMSPAEHDSVVALTSHLPQLVSTALALTLANSENPRLPEAFGPGLLDMTRLAMSSAELWQSILETNRGEVVTALTEFSETLAKLAEVVRTGGSLDEMFCRAKYFAEILREPGNW